MKVSRLPVRLVLLCAALPLLAACHKPGASSSANRSMTLESDPPNCEVFLDGTSLGHTPCVLTEARLRELGINWPEYQHNNNSLRESWQIDTAGIVIQPNQDEVAWRKLFFKPPTLRGSRFITTETPWGDMAMVAELDKEDADDDHLSYRAVSMHAPTLDSLTLKLSMPASAGPGAKCRVALACKNEATLPLVCFRPTVEIFCSKYDEPAMRHSVLKTALPDAWCFFKAGEENSATVDFTAPDAGGDYCVFAIVTLHQQAAGEGAYQPVYSNGKMLRVGQ